MDSALKQLKVPDLKRILADAAVAAPSRATKADLVARILDSPAAQAVYRAQYRPDADPPAEPQPPPAPAPAPEPAPPPAPAAAPAPSPPKARHAGHATVDHAVHSLPGQIRQKLESTPSRDPDAISNLLVDVVAAFDDAIAQDFFRIVPDRQTLEQLSNEQLRTLVDGIQASPDNDAIIKRVMHGTTALISLLDPSRQNLWVASLGDCQAALGQKDKLGEWTTSFLSSFHNGCDEAEVQRIRREHPGESECVHNDRVLGAIAVTRALGDHEFKFHPVFTDHILARTNPGFKFFATTYQDFLARIHTPPYLSNRPDVQHVNLTDRDQYQEILLIMCSDGLLDLYLDSSPSLSLKQLPQVWLTALDTRDTSLDAYNNLSLALLRNALGGKDTEKVSRNITVEMTSRWMDDTTILVQKI
ncbi:[Pyruvate dehydrogenase [acetyl-transferring]]-phosphatase 1, mitochondrial [Leucoagaricus sp. SymC.cos]|nr:[Pyruvate dehydrogenase [acetyl-transferring]]-phosphatase 1, mitochondrial [Leucoagaricus sp. SymC.cos]